MSTTGSSVADKLIEPVTAAAVAGYIQATGTLTPTKVALYVVGGAAVAGIIGFGICYFLSTQGYFPAVVSFPFD